MKIDRLSEATNVFAEATAAWPASVRTTRERIVASARREVARGRRRLVIVPIAAALIASTAWATVGRRLPGLFRALTWTPIESPRSETSTSARRGRHSPPAAPAPEIVPLPSTIGAPLPAPPGKHRAPSTTAALPAAPSPPPFEPVVDDLALYRVAHRFHFQDRDPDAAIEAWDAYLRASPAGAFVVEARYNRAMCLVRLGRAEEALQALAPFAEGVFGDYRRREARALVEALRP